MTVRSKIDTEITKRVGSWFTVRELQSKLRVSNSTLKPLIMRYARDQVLRRRRIKGEARAVEFSPAARSIKEFQSVMDQYMPYKAKSSKKTTSMKAAPKKSAKTSMKKTSSKTKSSSKKTSSKKSSGR